MPDIRKVPGMSQWRDYDPDAFLDGLQKDAAPDPAVPDEMVNRMADLVATYTGDNAVLIARQIAGMVTAHFRVDA